MINKVNSNQALLLSNYSKKWKC